jgi:hypothetical protein
MSENNVVTIHVEDYENEDDDTPKDSSTSSDIAREEEKWSSKNEVYLQQIRDKCTEKSKAHDMSSHKNKKFYIYASIPTIILPLVLANTTSYIPTDYNFVEPLGLTCIAIINGLKTLFNFSKKTEVHNTFAGKYSEIADDITTQLSRGKRFRIALDVYLERITSSVRILDASAPML